MCKGFGVVCCRVFFSSVSSVWWMCIGLYVGCFVFSVRVSVKFLLCSVDLQVFSIVMIFCCRLVCCSWMCKWLFLVSFMMCKFLISWFSFFICISRLEKSVGLGWNMLLVRFCRCLCRIVIGVCSLCVIVVFQKMCFCCICFSCLVMVLKLLISCEVLFSGCWFVVVCVVRLFCVMWCKLVVIEFKGVRMWCDNWMVIYIVMVMLMSVVMKIQFYLVGEGSQLFGVESVVGRKMNSVE